LEGGVYIILRKILLKPDKICIDASTICQLACPTCPRTQGDVAKGIGTGFLKSEDFKKLIDDNPWIKHAELSNWGEFFLNPELGEIIKIAFDKKISLRATNGANLNNVEEEVLENLVKYQLSYLTCAIDGASQQTYRIYRRGGDFNTVIKNIKKINQYKKEYNSNLPFLKWQFVAFGHNEHEITKARQMAQELGMSFRVKIAWDDFYYKNVFSPVKDKDLIRKESGIGVATRQEYKQKYGRDYLRKFCAQLWLEPQVNFDGKVLGCCINYWGDFGNALEEGLLNILNGEKMHYARQMLLGEKEDRWDIPCATCKIYKNMKRENAWIMKSEIRPNSFLKKNAEKLLGWLHLLSFARKIKKRLGFKKRTGKQDMSETTLKKKNALVLSSRFPPQGGIGTLRVLKFVKYLSSFGWQPTVLTVKEGLCHYPDVALLEEIPRDVNVYRAIFFDLRGLFRKVRRFFPFGNHKKKIQKHGLPSFEIEKGKGSQNSLKDVLEDCLYIPDSDIGFLPHFLLKGLWIIRNKPIDVIFTSAPPFSNLVVGLLLKMLTKKPWIVDYRDVWTSSERYAGRQKFITAIHKALEQKIIQKADLVVSTTDRMTAFHQNIFPEVPSEKFITITNGFDSFDFKQPTLMPRLRNSKCIMAHAGSITPVGASKTFFEAVNQIPENIKSEIEIVFAGNLYAPDRKFIEESNFNHLTRIKNFVSHSEAIKIQLDADILVCILGKFKTGHLHRSAKLYEYIASGKPILALIETDSATEDLLREVGGSIIVDIDDIEGIKKAILFLFAKFKCGELQSQRDMDLKKYERKELTRQLSEAMDKL
jgi:glycosyltransferase involved in cell wall biosynthesis/MoaA/NifB/PqqE/SkfB family radical SAM enzyme